MSAKGSFRRVGTTDQPLYGPRAVLVCGMPVDEQDTLLSLFAAEPFLDIPVIFADDTVIGERMESILSLPHLHGKGESSPYQRAVVMSGFTEQELHRFMRSFRETSLPRPVWATLTPHTEKWTLEQLIEELSSEHEKNEPKADD